MKKIGIFCAALLALGFTACDDTSDLGKMQINPQEPVMEANGIGISYLDEFAKPAFSLQGQEGKELNLVSWAVTQAEYALPENFHPMFRLRVASTQDFSDQITIDLAASETDPHNIMVSADSFNEAVITLFGRQPVARPVHIALEGFIVSGTQLTAIGDKLGEKTINVTPALDPAYSGIEPNYYLMTSLDGMTIDKAVKMQHSDKHQYDDPQFNYVLNITEDDLTAMGGSLKWMVVPESAYNTNNLAGAYGVAAGTAADVLSGELVLGGQAGELTAASKYMLVIDMLHKTYEFRYAADQLYVWTARGQFNKACLLTTDDNVHFSGAATLLANWKLTAQKDFKGLQFGTSTTAAPNTLVAGNKANPIKAEFKGLVWMDVNLADLSYNIQEVETLGLVGNMTGWGDLENGGKEDIEMTPNADFNIWTATVTFPENGDFKIRSNGNWDGFNLGGDLNNLNYGGANIACEPGTYDVVLTIGYDHVYTLTMTKK